MNKVSNNDSIKQKLKKKTAREEKIENKERKKNCFYLFILAKNLLNFAMK